MIRSLALSHDSEQCISGLSACCDVQGTLLNFLTYSNPSRTLFGTLTQKTPKSPSHDLGTRLSPQCRPQHGRLQRQSFRACLLRVPFSATVRVTIGICWGFVVLDPQCLGFYGSEEMATEPALLHGRRCQGAVGFFGEGCRHPGAQGHSNKTDLRLGVAISRQGTIYRERLTAVGM